MNLLDFIRSLESANLPPEQILITIKAFEETRLKKEMDKEKEALREKEEKKIRRREQGKNRQKNFRERRAAQDNVTQGNALHTVVTQGNALCTVTSLSSPSFPSSPLFPPHTPPISPTSSHPTSSNPKKYIVDLFENQSVSEEDVTRYKPERIVDDDFEYFFNEYGKVGNKNMAIKAYNKAIKGVDYATIIAGVHRYKAYLAANGWQSPKHGSTWLNNKGWEDDYTISPTGTTGKHTWADERDKLFAKYDAEAAEEERTRAQAFGSSTYHDLPTTEDIRQDD